MVAVSSNQPPYLDTSTPVDLNEQEFRICNKCGEKKRIDEFYRKTKAYDGLDTICKACQIENNRRRRKREKDAIGLQEAALGYEDPWRQLAAAVLHKAVRDWKNRRFKDRYELIMFFRSEWFDVLCFVVELDPEVVRGELEV